MAGPDKKYDKPEDKPAVGTPDDIKAAEKLPPSLEMPKLDAFAVLSADKARAGRTVKLVVTYGGLLLRGKLQPEGTEFEVDEGDAKSFLDAGTVALVTR